MAYGQWKVDVKATIEEFGYNPNELSYGSRKPVKCICEACGMVANKRFRESNAKHRCESIINGRKKCYKCKTFKPLEEFSKNKSTFDGYQKVCKDCFSNYDSVKKSYKKKQNKLKTDLKTYLRNKTSNLERKCKLKNLPFDLDKDYIYNLFLKQDGKCYFTGIDIKHNIGCHQYDSISIERLDPNGGYTKNNTVLSSFALNSFKGMMNESEFKNFLNLIIPNLVEYKNSK
jgi:hypothetical protein